MAMDWVQIVYGAIITGGVGLMWWDVRGIRSEMQQFRNELSAKVVALESKHNDCRGELPAKYADKKNVERLWERTDNLAADVAYAKGLRNGAH